MANKYRYRVCNKCGERKYILEFPIHNRRAGHIERHHTCKECLKEYYRQLRPKKTGMWQEKTSAGDLKVWDYDHGRRHIFWSEEDAKKFVKLFPYVSDKYLEEEFHLTHGTVRKRARDLGLKKNPDYIRALRNRNLDKARQEQKRHPTEHQKHVYLYGEATRFKPGEDRMTSEERSAALKKSWEVRHANILRQRREETLKQIKAEKQYESR